jgi:DNA polymerase I
MWIFDSYYKGCVELWGRDRGLSRASIASPPSFYMRLIDPPAHREMVEALESRYRVEECSFSTIFGSLQGYRIYAGRKVAEKIEVQTRYGVELYNVDVRQDQRYMAERDLFPCGCSDESRFSPDFEDPLTALELRVAGDPYLPGEISRVDVLDSRREGVEAETIRNSFRNSSAPRPVDILSGRRERFEGRERRVLSDLLELIRVHDPDLLLIPFADTWVPIIVKKARRWGLAPSISRSGDFRPMSSRSYWSYGRVYHKESALIPEGRVLIDTARSFVYRESGIKGVLLASRLTGLPPNLTSRFTPGTLISSYEVYEALRRGIAVPFRKRDAEMVRGFSELKASDKGGMIFQPQPGVYERVCQLDFTSLYPSIIVKYNLSPETIGHPERRGFLSTVLSSLLNLRIETKRRKKAHPEYAGPDSVMKWMLVTCFGYTGYRNAKFGQIQVHESITAMSRELLMQIKELAEGMGLQVLHGIVDCLWVKGAGPEALKEAADFQRAKDFQNAEDFQRAVDFQEAVERETGILTELEAYDWIAFLPMSDGSGSYNSYFGRLSEGKVKTRGVMARRGDTPEYVKRMQQELFQLLAEARNLGEIRGLEAQAGEIRRRYSQGLNSAGAGELAVRRRVSRLSYSRRCAEASAVEAWQRSGRPLFPGMEIGYVVRDAEEWAVEPVRVAVEEQVRAAADDPVRRAGEDTVRAGVEDLVRAAGEFDARYYEKLLDKAWREVAFVFGQ